MYDNVLYLLHIGKLLSGLFVYTRRDKKEHNIKISLLVYGRTYIIPQGYFFVHLYEKIPVKTPVNPYLIRIYRIFL
jgi:hypothetical protein